MTTTTAKTPAISAADYFAAKLAYDMTAWRLNDYLKKRAGDYLVLDVRDAEQYKAGHIPGAQNVPLQELPGKLASLPQDKTIVTYCGNLTCQLAPKAALTLAEKGFKVMELYGGWEDWQKKGFEVQK